MDGWMDGRMDGQMKDGHGTCPYLHVVSRAPKVHEKTGAHSRIS